MVIGMEWRVGEVEFQAFEKKIFMCNYNVFDLPNVAWKCC